MVKRDLQPHLVVFPELCSYYLSIEDREILYNATQVRNYIMDMIKKRQLELDQGINTGGFDLMTILL